MEPDWSQYDDAERIPGNVGGSWILKGTRIRAEDVLINAVDQTPEEIVAPVYPGLSVRPETFFTFSRRYCGRLVRCTRFSMWLMKLRHAAFAASLLATGRGEHAVVGRISPCAIRQRFCVGSISASWPAHETRRVAVADGARSYPSYENMSVRDLASHKSLKDPALTGTGDHRPARARCCGPDPSRRRFQQTHRTMSPAPPPVPGVRRASCANSVLPHPLSSCR